MNEPVYVDKVAPLETERIKGNMRTLSDDCGHFFFKKRKYYKRE